MDSAVYAATAEEVERGWLLGPYSPEELSRAVGPLWVPSRRFGVRQGGKVRPIDDFSEFWVNATVSVTDRLDLGGVDEVAALARDWAWAVGRERSVTVRPKGGRPLDGWD